MSVRWLLVLACVPFVFGITTEQTSRRLSVMIVSAPLSGHIAVPITLGKELVRRGHNVTLFTAHVTNYDRPRKKAEEAGMSYMSVDINVTFDSFEATFEKFTLGNDGILLSLFHHVKSMVTFLHTYESALDGTMLRNYDIILSTEATIPVAMCVSKKWDVPLIFLGTSRQSFPHQLPPWPYPSPLSHGTDNLDFIGRLYETLQRHIITMLFPVIVEVVGSELTCPQKVSTLVQAPGILVPHIVPTVIGFEYPRPLSPLTTYTGPIMSPLIDPLPDDVRVWLDSHSTGSVVYISMGSVAFIAHQVGRAIVEGLSATGYSAVWSLKKKNRAILDGLELNDKKILLLDWAPQLAILRHRSIRMAILHGGMNGVQEALHSGVPMIVLPIFGDQSGNAARVVHHGFGIRLDHKNISGTQIAESIHTIERGSYHKNVARLSKIFHHAGGVTKAADLVEFYAEVGYDHLIPAYARYEWTWIQYYNVDVYVVLLVIGGLVVWIMSRLCRCCCDRCFSTRCRGKAKKE